MVCFSQPPPACSCRQVAGEASAHEFLSPCFKAGILPFRGCPLFVPGLSRKNSSRKIKSDTRCRNSIRTYLLPVTASNLTTAIILRLSLPEQNLRSQHDNMWEQAMEGFKRVHHLPQVSTICFTHREDKKKNRMRATIQGYVALSYSQHTYNPPGSSTEKFLKECMPYRWNVILCFFHLFR